MKTQLTRLLAAALLLAATPAVLAQIGTAFTYQGQLLTTNGPAHGTYDMQFSLYGASSGGSALYGPVTTSGVSVSNGLFTVLIDFGSVFYNSTAYWLQIGVRTNGAASYTALSSRQELTPTPYANTAENLNGTLLASQLTGTLPSGLFSGIYGNAVTLNNPANSFSGNGSGLTGVNAATLGGLGASAFWQLSGNTVLAGQFLGSLNSQPVVFKVNNVPTLTLELNGSLAMGASTASGIDSVSLGFNSTTSGGDYEVAIGNSAQATGNGSVAIGWTPISSGPGSVALGESVTSSGNDSFAAGYGSRALGQWSVAIGYDNLAGGQSSWALGHLAQATNSGSFVWADESTTATFGDTRSNQFLIRANGGVGINTASPSGQLDVEDPSAFYNGIYVSHGVADGNGITVNAYNGTAAWGVYAASSGSGVVASGTAGSGVSGTSSSADGVDGTANGVSGIGMNGTHSASTGTAAGVQGTTYSTDGFANAVYGLVSSTSPGGSSAGVRGQNNGTGGLGIGVYGSQNGSGWGVYGYTPSGIGAYGDSSTGTGVEGQSGSGTGVYAYSSSGSALTIGGGAIHVSGAGVGTSTAAFIQVTAAANIVANETIINNPLCNSDPNAILIVTHNDNPGGVFHGENNHVVGVFYSSPNWTIYNEDNSAMATGLAFNVLIIKN